MIYHMHVMTQFALEKTYKTCFSGEFPQNINTFKGSFSQYSSLYFKVAKLVHYFYVMT